jgi:cell division protein FtsB
MYKKFLGIFALAVLLSLFFVFNLRAQKPVEQTGQADIAQLQAKIDRLATKVDILDREITNKLDKILSNQDAILKELQIVKVRATRK